MSNYITTDYLNIRKEPFINKENILAVMPPDTIVEKISEHNSGKWYKIKTVLGNSILNGHAFASYLTATDNTLSQVEESPITKIPGVNLTPANGKIISRSVAAGAYPINEASLIRQNLTELFNTAEASKEIHQMLDYLDVEHSIRYAPASPKTFCNIYAFDVCYCMGADVYIPRVWWQETAVSKILNGEEVPVIYEKTVTELNANSLASWFENYGQYFGWKRVFDLTEMQENVNAGTLGIIVGQRINLNNPGHIAVVVPERAGFVAERKDNKIISPLQSQAGSKNKKYFTGNNWWENANRFKKFGFWVWNKQ